VQQRCAALEEWGSYLAGQVGFAVTAPQQQATEQSDEISSQAV